MWPHVKAMSQKLIRIAIPLFGISFVLPAASTVDLAVGSGIGWDYCEGSFNLMRTIFKGSGSDSLPWNWKAYLLAFSWLANVGFGIAAAEAILNRGKLSALGAGCAVAAALVGVAAVIVYHGDREALGLAPVVWAVALILGALAGCGRGAGAYEDRW